MKYIIVAVLFFALGAGFMFVVDNSLDEIEQDPRFEIRVKSNIIDIQDKLDESSSLSNEVRYYEEKIYKWILEHSETN